MALAGLLCDALARSINRVLNHFGENSSYPQVMLINRKMDLTMRYWMLTRRLCGDGGGAPATAQGVTAHICTTVTAAPATCGAIAAASTAL